jgi:hypothetical protein
LKNDPLENAGIPNSYGLQSGELFQALDRELVERLPHYNNANDYPQ